ncbi:MAG: branched-chain amino acid aminotransferase [Clostridiales bacterium]|jgi:branched-chain amino acid aminotransferase|nr:branched-chain amino acid aminotransferase [Clostridiales bacterium]
MKITLTENKKKKPDFAKLGFGKYMSDHMLVMDYADGKWGEPEIVPYDTFKIDPATQILHYGQGLFEGLKAYKTADGKITLFRPRDNILRMNKGADRLCMPKLDVDKILSALYELVKTDADWIPTTEGTSLYIRPAMFCTDVFLGVKVGATYRFFIAVCPVGAYYANGLKPTKIFIEDFYVRSSIGGTGDIKCLGNYAASLIGQEKAHNLGCDQALWLDAADKKYIEEVGSMNIFFVIGDTVVTPALSGSILPGITRNSALQILRKDGYKAEERKISVDELLEAHRSGTLKEIFGTGTAAVISPVGEFIYKDKSYTVGDGSMGKITEYLYDKLTGIQTGKLKDEYNWVVNISK